MSKTYGANIYSLLKDSFFLQAYIGEHTRLEIQKLINTLQPNQNITGNKRSTSEILEDSPALLKKRIELIGEEFLRNRLLDMFYKKFDRERQISELERQLNKLKNAEI